ncbi:MAG TPA: FtsX-like permease family protein, partial [Verrucomicrobiae bacterium]|nr:FtsX-like permease family protein [Verrucomicrobiae bacterium]
GSLAALSGIGLAMAASWSLAKFLFDVPFAWPSWSLLVAFLAVTGLTVVIGMLASRGVLRESPLAILRQNV